MGIFRRMHRSAGRKGVSEAGGYFMGYYTIWLSLVKRYFVPFWELAVGRPYGRFKTRGLRTRDNGTPLFVYMRRARGEVGVYYCCAFRSH